MSSWPLLDIAQMLVNRDKLAGMAENLVGASRRSSRRRWHRSTPCTDGGTIRIPSQTCLHTLLVVPPQATTVGRIQFEPRCGVDALSMMLIHCIRGREYVDVVCAVL